MSPKLKQNWQKYQYLNIVNVLLGLFTKNTTISTAHKRLKLHIYLRCWTFNNFSNDAEIPEHFPQLVSIFIRSFSFMICNGKLLLFQ